MYTVIRFMFDNNPNALVGFGEKLNKIIPGAFSGEDRIKQRFSCSMSKSDNWYEHLQDILKWLASTGSLIDEARDTGADVQIDCAIEPEDVHGRFLRSCMITNELIAKLAEIRVPFVLSLYLLDSSASDHISDIR